MKLSVLILLSLGLVLGSCAPGSTTQPPTGVGVSQFTIAYADGTVMVDGKAAVIGAVVPQNATVTTGKDGTCEIVFDKKNILRLKENTVFVLNSLTFPQTVELKSGALGLVLHKLSKVAGIDSFKVKTPQVALGVRGTVFFVKADNKETYHCSCNGHVEISPFGGESVVLSASHHAARIIGIDAVIKESTMLDHDDAFLDSLAARIGDSINWSVQE